MAPTKKRCANGCAAAVLSSSHVSRSARRRPKWEAPEIIPTAVDDGAAVAVAAAAAASVEGRATRHVALAYASTLHAARESASARDGSVR